MKFNENDNFQLLDDIKEYLSPEETEISLLQSYASALSANLLKQDSVPYKIALHHVNYRKQHPLAKESK